MRIYATTQEHARAKLDGLPLLPLTPDLVPLPDGMPVYGYCTEGAEIVRHRRMLRALDALTWSMGFRVPLA